MAERKAIFVTGGASGIGREIACYFGERGWFVGLADVDTLGMQDTEGLLPGGFSYSRKLDVRDRDAWDDALAAFAKAAGGKIHVVANNAGVPLGGPLAENSKEEIDRCLDINMRGVLYGAQASYPWLKASGPGSCLLNTASAAGLYGTGGASVYSATKFGVRGMTEALDAEWNADGIKVRALCPGFIDTPLLDHTTHQQSNESIGARVRAAGLDITSPEEVAKAAWDAVHGDGLLYLVGKTAKTIGFAARWMPGRMRKRAKSMAGPLSSGAVR